MKKAARAVLSDVLQQFNAQAESQRAEAEAMRGEAIKLATQVVQSHGGQLLDAKAGEIDRELKAYRDDLRNVLTTNATRFGEIAQAIEVLTSGTDKLRQVLFNPSKRGKWGERLAEDILKWAGFIEGKNYRKQASIDDGGVPDYEFDMPPDRVLYMDSKFPFDQYAAHLAAEDDDVRKLAGERFIATLRGHIKKLAERGYATASTKNAIDYVLMFVPNESIYAFINELDPDLIDTALKEKVVLCSPLTLYAFLVVVRQASESFNAEKSVNKIMQYVSAFEKEWEKYTKAVGAVQKRFKSLSKGLDTIAVKGRRFNALGRYVTAIDDLRRESEIDELSPEALAALLPGDEGDDEEDDAVDEDDDA